MDGRWRDASRSVAGVIGSVAGALMTALSAPPPARRWPLRTRGRWTGRPRDLTVAVDSLLAVVVTATMMVALLDAGHRTSAAPIPRLATVITSLALGLLLATRDRFPIATWRVSVALIILSTGLVAPTDVAVPLYVIHLLVAVVLSCTAVVRADRPIAFGVWLTIMVTAAVVGNVIVVDAPTPEQWVTVIVLLTAPVVFGHSVRDRRRTEAELVGEQRRADVARAGRRALGIVRRRDGAPRVAAAGRVTATVRDRAGPRCLARSRRGSALRPVRAQLAAWSMVRGAPTPTAVRARRARTRRTDGLGRRRRQAPGPGYRLGHRRRHDGVAAPPPGRRTATAASHVIGSGPGAEWHDLARHRGLSWFAQRDVPLPAMPWPSPTI